MKAKRNGPGRRKKDDAKSDGKSTAGTAQTIKKVATALFAEKGFKNSSVKDITEAAKVNIGAINYHFQSKDNLLQEIVKEYTSINMNSVVRTLKKKAKSVIEARIIFEIAMNEMLETAYEYRDTLKILRREISQMPDEVKNILGGTFLGIYNIFIDFIETGKKNALIHEDIDAMQVVLLIYSYQAAISYDEILPLAEPYNKQDISDSTYREHAVASISRILFGGIAATEQ